jgi:hypothetical protein
MNSPKNVERSMRLLAGYFGVYAAIGFGYPLVTGEGVFETFGKYMGWKKEGEAKMDCESYYDKKEEEGDARTKKK